MPQPLRIGILGAGYMAKVHGTNLNKIDGVEIAAICSFDPALSSTLAQDIGAPNAALFEDFTRMLDESKLDAVCIAVPPFVHKGEVVAAAQRGLHILIEKPIALKLETARAMADAVQKAGVISQVGYQFRFKNSIKRLHAAIADGTAGKPTLFTGRFWVNMDGSPWWRDASQSGGQIFEQLIHFYNLAVASLGTPVSVTGLMANLCHADQDDYRIEDTSVGTIRFANGALASITGSNCAVPGRFFSDFRIVCEKITVDYQTTGQPWVKPDLATWYEGDQAEEIDESGDPHNAVDEDFIAAIREGRPARCPIAEGARDAHLVQTIVQSAQQNETPLEFNPA